MFKRHIDPSMDEAVVIAIDQRLEEVCRSHNVVIPLAIESGSRAWGFPSPDSDYDCRFIFIRPVEEYLTPWQRRDVIETPLDAVFDVNGWDIGKAIKLMAGGNAVILEWLTSKIIYRSHTPFQSALLALAEEIVERDALAYHYISLGREMGKRLRAFGDEVPQKKIFYVLRPAMALRWLRLNSTQNLAPMHFPTLMKQCDLPVPFTAEINDLLQKKAQTRELGVAPLSKQIEQFFDEEFSLAEQHIMGRPRARNCPPHERAEQFFREIVLERKGF